jgi:hypothetical protein
MTWQRPVFDFGRTFSDRNGIDDLPSQLSSGARLLRPASDTAHPQMINQLLLQYPARLDEEAPVDRFVGDAHGRLVGILPSQPSSDP